MHGRERREGDTRAGSRMTLREAGMRNKTDRATLEVFAG